MKARVKLTGQIVDVVVKEIPQYGIQGENIGGPIEYHITRFYDGENYYRYDELDFDVESFDYWTRLEHQAAISAMGGMCGNTKYNDYAWVDMAKFAIKAAHALVEKMKEK